MKIGEIVKKYREDHGMSQRQFAKACGLTNAYISILEKDFFISEGRKITPTLGTLRNIANGLNMSLQDLMEMADDMPVKFSADISNKNFNLEGLDTLEPARRELMQKVLDASEDELDQIGKIFDLLKGN